MIEMKFRKILYITLFTSVCIISFLLFKSYSKSVKDEYCLTTQISSRIFDFNTFSVEVFDGLNKMDFIIVSSGNTIFENGMVNKGIKNEYGFCLFDLFYKENKIFEIGHYKYNNWYTFDYILKIKKVNGVIEPRLKVSGKNSQNLKIICKIIKK